MELKNLYSSNQDRIFQVQQMLNWNALHSVRSVEPETYASLLDAVGEVAGKSIASRAKKNNETKYQVNDGKLIWPQGIKDSYQDVVNLGLNAATVDEKYGGMGLPFLVNMMMLEMLFQADAGFATIPALQTGVADLIETFASEELKQKYLPFMTSGKYTGAMDLTEAGAGSDLGRIKSKATTTGIEGIVSIDGEKIFISNGGAEIHVVLARDTDTYNETLGTTKGISLYLVPRELDEKPNGVRVERVEEKIGLHSSPTCTVTFSGAQGYQIGEKGNGVKHMFQLMNNARLSVAAQALGLLEGAYLLAKNYSEEREQFGSKIIQHSQVKDMLKDIRLYAEVIRSVLYPAAFAVDMEKGLRKKINIISEQNKETINQQNQQEKQSLEKLISSYATQAAILTPAIKCYAAEKSIELIRKALQVHGGNGYISEYDIGRYFRDAPITAIYEGTSEIQANLLMRQAAKGVLFPFLQEVQEDLERMMGVENTVENIAENRKLAQKVKESCTALQDSLLFISQLFGETNDSNLSLIKAKEIAFMTVEVYAGYQLLLQAQKSAQKKIVAEVFIREELEPNTLRNQQRIKNLEKNTLKRYDKILGR